MFLELLTKSHHQTLDLVGWVEANQSLSLAVFGLSLMVLSFLLPKTRRPRFEHSAITRTSRLSQSRSGSLLEEGNSDSRGGF